MAFVKPYRWRTVAARVEGARPSGGRGARREVGGAWIGEKDRGTRLPKSEDAHTDHVPAEEVGFEPTVPRRGTPVFETGPFNHSGTPPGGSDPVRSDRLHFTQQSSSRVVRRA